MNNNFDPGTKAEKAIDPMLEDADEMAGQPGQPVNTEGDNAGEATPVDSEEGSTEG